MIWLLGQVWPLLLASSLAGAVSVALFGQRSSTVEAWEEVPVPAPAPDPEPEPEPEPASGTLLVDADDPGNPFPVAAPQGEPAPWEQEELWSRPARVSATGAARRPKDEWSEAAQNWRSWADEATGRGYAAADDNGADAPIAPSDRDLFAADRDQDPPEVSSTTPEASGQPGADEDVFPFARPVEAPFPAAEDPSRGSDADAVSDDPEDYEDEDDREAAEIRRMREQARRGETG